MNKPLPIEVILRDLNGYAERHPNPYVLWAEGIREALKDKDAEIERLNGLLLRAVEKGEECVEIIKDLLKDKSGEKT